VLEAARDLALHRRCLKNHGLLPTIPPKVKVAGRSVPFRNLSLGEMGFVVGFVAG
jgi:hypothetical protein